MTKTCACGCGKEFTPTHGHQKYIEKHNGKINQRNYMKRKEEVQVMTIPEFAKIRGTHYDTVRYAVKQGRLNHKIEKLPNGVDQYFVVMDELAEEYEPDYADRTPIVLKTEKDETGQKAPQDAWEYRNDCMGRYIRSYNYEFRYREKPITHKLRIPSDKKTKIMEIGIAE